jgi:hypothetical protein
MVADVLADRRPVVMPHLVAAAGIDRPDIVRHREVEDSIHEERTGLDFSRQMSLEGPGHPQIADVLRCDLGELAVTPAGVIAMVERPRVRGRAQELSVVEVLRGERRRRCGNQEECGGGKKSKLQSNHLGTGSSNNEVYGRAQRSVCR